MTSTLLHQPSFSNYTTDELIEMRDRKKTHSTVWLPFKWVDIVTEIKRRKETLCEKI